MGFKNRVKAEYVKYRKHPRAYEQRIKRHIKSGIKTGKSIVEDVVGIGKAGAQIAAHAASSVATEGASTPGDLVAGGKAGVRGYKHAKRLVNTVRGAVKSLKRPKKTREANVASSVKGKTAAGGQTDSTQGSSPSSLDQMQKLSRA